MNRFRNFDRLAVSYEHVALRLMVTMRGAFLTQADRFVPERGYSHNLQVLRICLSSELKSQQFSFFPMDVAQSFSCHRGRILGYHDTLC